MGLEKILGSISNQDLEVLIFLCGGRKKVWENMFGKFYWLNWIPEDMVAKIQILVVNDVRLDVPLVSLYLHFMLFLVLFSTL